MKDYLIAVVCLAAAFMLLTLADDAKSETLGSTKDVEVRGNESVPSEPRAPFSGVYIGAGVTYNRTRADARFQQDREVQVLEEQLDIRCVGECQGPIFNTVTDNLRASFEDNIWGFTASGLVQRHVNNSPLVVGLEAGGSYSNDIAELYLDARIGWAMGMLMPYVVAGAGVDFPDFRVSGVNVDDSNFNFRLGGGGQLKFSDKLSLDIKYVHVFEYDVSVANVGNIRNIDVDAESDRIYGQLRYRF